MFYVLPAAAFEIGDLELQAKQNFGFQILNLQVERLTKMLYGNGSQKQTISIGLKN